MNDDPVPKDSAPPAGDMSAASESNPLRVIRSEELFAGGKIVLIQHAGEQYRLLITRNDRLILQK